MMSNPYEKIKIVKLFASSEYKIRNNAYKSIIRLLKFEFGKEKKQLSEKEILAIWKGLYVWLWMQDKPILHEEVVDKICNLLPGIESDKVALEFMRSFFITMNREWSKIDVHRVDKYYLLVRQFFGASLRWLAAKKWAHIDEYLAMVRHCLLVPSRNGAIGLRMHFFDIVLDELCRAAVCGPVSTRLVTELILSVQSVNYQQILVQKLRRSVIDRLQPLQQRKQLQVDLRAIGQRMLEAATVNDSDSKQPMSNKTRKLFYGLANRFRQCKATEGGEAATTDATEEVAVDESTTSTAMEADESAPNEPVDDIEMAEQSSQEPEPEQITIAPATVATEVTQTAPASNKTPKQQRKKQSRKADIDRNDACHKRSDSEDKRVTFGKRYIKRFSKGTTNISVSQGTVKQDHMKSILKK